MKVGQIEFLTKEEKIKRLWLKVNEIEEDIEKTNGDYSDKMHKRELLLSKIEKLEEKK